MWSDIFSAQWFLRERKLAKASKTLIYLFLYKELLWVPKFGKGLLRLNLSRDKYFQLFGYELILKLLAFPSFHSFK